MQISSPHRTTTAQSSSNWQLGLMLKVCNRKEAIQSVTGLSKDHYSGGDGNDLTLTVVP
jgi:hypothetical protein